MDCRGCRYYHRLAYNHCLKCDGKGYERPTRADRIRAFTDEELAWAYAYRLASCYGCEASTMEDCAKCTLDWLKQEAKEDDDEQHVLY